MRKEALEIARVYDSLNTKKLRTYIENEPCCWRVNRPRRKKELAVLIINYVWKDLICRRWEAASWYCFIEHEMSLIMGYMEIAFMVMEDGVSH